MALNRKLFLYLLWDAFGRLGMDLFLVSYQCDLVVLLLWWSVCRAHRRGFGKMLFVRWKSSLHSSSSIIRSTVSILWLRYNWYFESPGSIHITALSCTDHDCPWGPTWRCFKKCYYEFAHSKVFSWHVLRGIFCSSSRDLVSLRALFSVF